MTVRVYKSTDTNAPIVTSHAGALTQLLDACLVNGYGSTRASATVTVGTTVSDGDTITIDGITYTWKTALTPSANQVLIGVSAATNLSNLAAAIADSGVRNTNYGTGTTQQTNVFVSALTSSVLTLTAYKGGTAGNSIAISKSAAQITLSGATLTGGSGTDTTVGAGWTKPFSGTNTAMYRPSAGNQFYLNVLDNAPGAGLATEARISGFEVATSATAGTFQFPTVSQRATNMFARKSVSGAPQTARPWFVIADERTVYVFISSEGSTQYTSFMFGEIYSYLSGDGFRTVIIGRHTENSASVTAADESLGSVVINIQTGQNASYVARTYSGLGGSEAITKVGDAAMSGGSTALVGVCPFPNPVDGALYLSRVYVHGATGAPANHRRGYLRGFYQFLHSVGGVVDGDTFVGAAGTEFAGKTFMIIEIAGSGGVFCMEISNTWDTSA